MGVGFLNEPGDETLHRAVVLSVMGENGPLLGIVHPDYAEQLGRELIEHAASCTPMELEVVAELPPEMRN